MKFRRLSLICLAAAMIAALSSCGDDDDETTTSDSLSGTPDFSMPQYVYGYESFTLIPTGVSNPTGDVGYYWVRSWQDQNDTTKLESDSGDGRYKFVTPGDVGEYNVQCTAFAEGYYTSSRVVNFCVVNPEPNTTITGVNYSKKDGYFVDNRDGKTYFTAEFGGQTWMKNNLAYKEAGVSYCNSVAMDEIVGRFYTWSEAQNACPEGWHLPSDAEYAQLANALAGEGSKFVNGDIFKGVAGGMMVDAEFIGNKMWEFWPDVKITNKSGFSALPVGYAVDQGTSNNFNGVYNYATFWTSDSEGDSGYYRYLYVDKVDVFPNSGDKVSFRASVRCVKN